jgi:DNA repair protein RadD
LIKLRDYQSDMVERVKSGMSRHKWQLLQLATGGGKTFTAGHMINSARLKGNTCFFVVPRRELLKQTAESYASVGIPFSYVAAGYTYNPFAKVQLCTVGSLAKRLDKVKPPRLMFVDETHYGSNQLGQIIQWAKDAGSYGVGLSATPSRTDGRGLGMWYSDMVEGPTTRDLIDRGELSDYRLFGVDNPDMTGIRTVAGDYAKGQLADKMEQDKVLVGSAVSHYRAHAMGRLNVAFCASVKHAEIVADSFRQGGVPAACIHGGQDDAERARIIRAFARRELLVLTSCQLLTFGFDLSSAAQMDVTVECISDLQPTQSLAMQLQKYGRALRKKDYPALLFDHAGNAARHGFPDDERDWTLEDKEKRKGGNSEPTLPVRQCPECYFVHRPSPVCPNCGFEYPVASRVIEEVEGELQELERERQRKAERMEQGMAKTYPELVALAVMKGYRNPHGWAQAVIKGRGRKVAVGS